MYKLQRAILRSNIAYNLYLSNKTFIAAKRIYKSNKIIYDLLNEYIFIVEDNYVSDLINYMMHLEDWFIQFESEESKVKDISEVFIFERVTGGIPYPNEFVTKIKENEIRIRR